MNRDWIELLSLFNDSKIRFMIIGGHAVMKYAENRSAMKLIIAILGFSLVTFAAEIDTATDFSLIESLYKHLHQNPELSFAEKETAKRIAAELRAAKFEVTEGVGGNGVVGVFKNGHGPTVLVRTDLDALPVKEQTGVPHASKATSKDELGNEVSIMHACGHDVHMTAFVGAARALAAAKDKWRGTLVFIAQPAEERLGGAVPMLKDGLYSRFPKPDFCLALHVAADLPAGSVGFTEGFGTANVNAVDIVVRGIGGHGAWPHKTKDPIVLASQIVLALQTIVSRETDPLESAVVTVGSIHGGAKRNVISDQVTLQLTLRSYSDEVRTNLLSAIRRICDGLGRAAGLPENILPTVTIAEEPGFAIYNDHDLTRRLAKSLSATLGEKNVVDKKPVMGGEDFSEFGRTPEKIPICMFWLGTVNPEKFKSGAPLPSLHSAYFAPDIEPTLKTGVKAMTIAVLELMAKP